tara:strand:- start:539 stop:940 length:402 start_codon:yes stop_codon:yes gene_type:complete
MFAGRLAGMNALCVASQFLSGGQSASAQNALTFHSTQTNALGLGNSGLFRRCGDLLTNTGQFWWLALAPFAALLLRSCSETYFTLSYLGKVCYFDLADMLRFNLFYTALFLFCYSPLLGQDTHCDSGGFISRH